MIISSIVAISNNYAIGVDNDLPWHMPADLKFFKDTTYGKYVLMGRKSYESVGKPLPGRTNIVVTRKKDYFQSGIIVVNSITDGIKVAQDAGQTELFILGGSNIYSQTINLWNRLYITKIDTVINNATAFFPKINLEAWRLTHQDDHQADKKNPHNYSFCTYMRSYDKSQPNSLKNTL